MIFKYKTCSVNAASYLVGVGTKRPKNSNIQGLVYVRNLFHRGLCLRDLSLYNRI